jgi:hypothetical protein
MCDDQTDDQAAARARPEPGGLGQADLPLVPRQRGSVDELPDDLPDDAGF